MFRHSQALSWHFHITFTSLSLKLQNCHSSVVCHIHVTFMTISCHFQSTCLSLSCRPRTWLPKQFHDTFMADSWCVPGTFPSNKHGYKHIDKKHIYIYIHRYINTYVFFVAVPLFMCCFFLTMFFFPSNSLGATATLWFCSLEAIPSCCHWRMG